MLNLFQLPSLPKTARSPEWTLKKVGNYPLEASKVPCYTRGMDTKSPTLRQFLDQFPTEELCLDHIMRQRFGIQHECGSCGREAKFYRVKARRSYACEWCGYQVFP